VSGNVRSALFNALSASRTRRFRACSRVERESLIRDTAALSGAIWKFPAVWWISWEALVNDVRKVMIAYGRGIFVEQHFEYS
jgi:hypothetical protein